MERPRSQKKAGRRPAATTAPDDAGAADLSRRLAENLRGMRKTRGMSLDDLAAASGVSRAALWQIESCKTNPSIGVLWKIAAAFGVAFSELMGAGGDGTVVLRRADVQVLRSADGRFESRLASPSAAASWIELYDLRLAPHAVHASDAHAQGTRELLVVLSGGLRLTIDRDTYMLGQGDSVFFLADRAHVYENPGTSEARYHNVIIYRR